MNDKKLYIEYRVYFNPNTNQELLHTIAELGQDEIFYLFDGEIDGENAPHPHDVTYEVVMEVSEDK